MVVAKTTEVENNRTINGVNSSTPLVSVIIPVYNVAKILERCVNSVLAQTYEHLEIILVDDGSTDFSRQFCDAFAKKDSRVQVIHQPNQGLSAARNAGLARATGAYITFVDSDDSVQPYLVELLLGLCQQHQVKLAIAGFRELSSTTETFPNLDQRAELGALGSLTWPDSTPLPENVELLSTTACLTRMLSDQGFTVSAWSKLYARELFSEVRFPVGKLYEDVGTTYRLVLQCPEVAVSALQPYNYYHNPDSITKSTYTPAKLDLIALTDQMCDQLLAWSEGRDAAERTQINFLVKKRRAHARFSILRQMVMLRPQTLPPAERKAFLAQRREIVRYLRQHRQDIFRNPLASRRDRLAMTSLIVGLPAFRAAWKSYQNRQDRL